MTRRVPLSRYQQLLKTFDPGASTVANMRLTLAHTGSHSATRTGRYWTTALRSAKQSRQVGDVQYAADTCVAVVLTGVDAGVCTECIGTFYTECENLWTSLNQTGGDIDFVCNTLYEIQGPDGCSEDSWWCDSTGVPGGIMGQGWRRKCHEMCNFYQQVGLPLKKITVASVFTSVLLLQNLPERTDHATPVIMSLAVFLSAAAVNMLV